MKLKTIGWYARFAADILSFAFYSPKAKKYLKAEDTKNFDAYVQKKVRWLATDLEKVAGLTYTVEGRENLPKDGPIVYGCNHQSIFDAAVMVNQARELSGFIMKNELSKVPLARDWARYFHAVFCERKDKTSSHNAYEDAVCNLKKGFSMVIFFEGTRSKDKEHELARFKTGAFRMAMESGAPLVPVIICGTAKALEDTKEVVPSKGIVKYLPPVTVPQMDHDELNDFIANFRENYEKEYKIVRARADELNR